MLNTLAAACAESGDFDAAIRHQKNAIERIQNDAEFVKGANARLVLYKVLMPYRDK